MQTIRSKTPLRYLASNKTLSSQVDGYGGGGDEAGKHSSERDDNRVAHDNATLRERRTKNALTGHAPSMERHYNVARQSSQVKLNILNLKFAWPFTRKTGDRPPNADAIDNERGRVNRMTSTGGLLVASTAKRKTSNVISVDERERKVSFENSHRHASALPSVDSGADVRDVLSCEHDPNAKLAHANDAFNDMEELTIHGSMPSLAATRAQ